MMRVLFVDDEPFVLDALRNSLRKQRQVWDMAFAEGAQAALDLVAAGAFDVIVSDMRMPEIDGAELLRRVRDTQPAAIRIVLSGHAEREAVQRAIGVAHQFLSKPCEPETLRCAVERACGLQSLLGRPEVREVAGRIEKLPPAPDTYFELTRALSDPGVSAAEVAAVIEKDPAMTAKVLQLVSSAYFGLPRQTASMREAVSYLGLDLVKGLALTAHVFAAMEGAPATPGFCLKELQRSALLCAQIGKLISQDMKQDARQTDEVFTACLVHDVGQLVCAQAIPERFAQCIQESRATGEPLFEVEKRVSGPTHSDLGGYLLGAWGLPFAIVEAAAFHHEPARAAIGPFGVLHAVHIADALAEEVLRPGAPGRYSPDAGVVEAAGAAHLLPSWRAAAARIAGAEKHAA